jgi:hypothetical protein
VDPAALFPSLRFVRSRFELFKDECPLCVFVTRVSYNSEAPRQCGPTIRAGGSISRPIKTRFTIRCTHQKK